MKKILVFTFMFFTTCAIAQDKNAEKTVQKFLFQFNKSSYDEIYDSFSSDYKRKVSKETLTSYLNKIHGMVDKFKSAKFISANGGSYNYFFVCKDKNVNADFQCILNAENQFDYLSFKRIGGSGNPPPVGKLKQ